MSHQLPAQGTARVDTLLLARTIAWSMLLSVFVYGGVGYAFLEAGGPASFKGLPAIPWLRWVLYVLAALVQAATGLVERLGPCRRENVPAQVLAVRPGQHLLTRTVVRLALAEVPAIVGLLLIFVFRNPLDFQILGAASLVLMVLRWPTADEWLRDEQQAALVEQR